MAEHISDSSITRRRFLTNSGVLLGAGSLLAVASPFTGLLSTPDAFAASYTALLPKPAVATSLLVVDITKEVSAGAWASTEAIWAATAIQGVVNRTNGQKIYFIDSSGDDVPVEQTELSNNVFPVSHTTAQLDTSQSYPALYYLLQHFSSFIKGKVRYANMTDTSISGPFVAALNAVGQTNAIPTSPRLETWLSSKGYSFTLLADTTSLTTNTAAFNWAYQNYFNANTTRAFVAKMNIQDFGGYGPWKYPTNDYFISSKAFILCADANVSVENAYIPTLLNTNNYPLGTPVLGYVNGEGTEISVIQAQGYFFEWLNNTWNTSVHASFTSDPTLLTAPTPKVATYDAKGIYVALYITDGDNFYQSSTSGPYYMMTSANAGQVPLGWSVNAMSLDLFPLLLQWRSAHTYSGAYEYVSMFADGGAPAGSQQQTSYSQRYNHYQSVMHGFFSTINYLDGNDTVISQLNPAFGINGYQGAIDGNSVNYYTLNSGSVLITEPSGATQGATNGNESYAQEIVNAINTAANSQTSGQPAFVVVAVGDAYHSGDPNATAVAVKSLLQNQGNGHNYYLMRPVDLAATWNAYSGAGTILPTYTFKDLVRSADGAAVNGTHGGINFGTGQWEYSNHTYYPSYALTNFAFFSQNVTSRTFTLPGGCVLTSIALEGTGTYSLSDGANSTVSGSLSGMGSPNTINTGWTKSASTVTVTLSGSWGSVISNIIYTYNFSGLAGSADGTPVDGSHGGINFGTGQWQYSNHTYYPTYALANFAYFSQNVSSRTFAVPAGTVLTSIALEGGGTYSLSDGVNSTVSGSLAGDGSPNTINTGWTHAAPTVTVTLSGSWGSVISNIFYAYT